jgi:hypothetical protein
MKTNLGYFPLIMIYILLIGCSQSVKPQKFPPDPRVLKPLSSNVPLQVLVPKNAEAKYLIELSGQEQTEFTNLYVDLNDVYKNVKELIEEVLVKQGVPLSSSSKKYLKFTINKIWRERWASGLIFAVFLDFDIETGAGYRKHYRVEDHLSATISRDLGGTTKRAVEEIFQDGEIIAYIEMQ